jgi:hypothetical protein
MGDDRLSTAIIDRTVVCYPGKDGGGAMSVRSRMDWRCTKRTHNTFGSRAPLR